MKILVFRIGFYDKDKLLGVCLSVLERARRGRYLTVPAGPVIDWKNQVLVGAWMKSLRSIARQTDASFVRVRPQLIDTENSLAIFRTLGFRPAPMHLHAQLTNELDITKTEEELLLGMRKSTRYEIRQSDKAGIRVSASTNPKDIKAFYDLQLTTAKRQGFVPFSLTYLEEQFRVFARQDMATLFSSWLGSTLLAQAFIIFYGHEAVYHYGASTDEARKYPGAYAIQWAAIREAKKRGMKTYNFWGVAPENEPNHRFSSLSLFKRGFGGKDVSYLPAQDLVVDPLRYAVSSAFETVRKAVRRV